jgi:hypothetical protein
MTDLPPTGFVRALTFEEMSPEQREFYTRRRRRHDGLPQCQGLEYDILAKFDDEIPGCHRDKND